MIIKNYVANILLALLSTLVTLALIFFAIEIYLRTQFSGGETHELHDMMLFHEERGWELKPGHFRHFTPGAMTLTNIAINKLGMRGPEVQVKASPERKRVTLVGDSFLFAASLNEADTLTGRVQMGLGNDYEIVNLGVPGYGTGQEILSLLEQRKKGYDWGSRVILVFFMNDIQDNLGLDYATLARLPHRPAIRVGSDGNLVIEKPIKPIGRENSAKPTGSQYLFYPFLRNRAELLAARFPFLVKTFGEVTGASVLPRDPGIIKGWYTEGWEARWQVTSRLIEYMADMVRTQNGSDFDVVFIPSPFQVEPVFKEVVASYASQHSSYEMFLVDIDRPQRVLMKHCEESKIHCVDVTDRLRMASREQPTYFLREGHLNIHGVRAISDVFVELIRR